MVSEAKSHVKNCKWRRGKGGKRKGKKKKWNSGWNLGYRQVSLHYTERHSSHWPRDWQSHNLCRFSSVRNSILLSLWSSPSLESF